MKRILTTVPDGPDSTAMIDLSEIIMFSADNAEGRQRTVIRFAGAASTPFWLEIPFEKFKELMADPERICTPFSKSAESPATKEFGPDQEFGLATPPNEPRTCLYLMPPDHKTNCSNQSEPGWTLCRTHLTPR